MYTQLPLTVVACQRDGVVEVPGVVGVDGDDGLVPQIEALAGRGLRAVGLAGLPRFFETLGRELLRQAMLPDDAHDVDARIAVASEDLHNHAPGFNLLSRVLRDFNDDLGIGFDALGARIRDENRGVQNLAVGEHVPLAARLVQPPDELAVTAFDDFLDAPLMAHLAVAFAPLEDAGHDGVARHGGELLSGRNKEIAVSGG